MANLEISDLLERLHRLRDRAREIGPTDIYIDLIEACALCEALANRDGEWNKSIEVDQETPRAKRQGIHLVTEKPSA